MISVHTIQNEITFLTAWIYNGDTAAHVQTLVTDHLFQPEDDLFLVAVRPQPTSDMIHFMATAAWIVGMGFYSVMIDNRAQLGAMFMHHFKIRIHFDDIGRLIGVSWRAGSKIWVAGYDEEFEPDSEIQAFQRMLLVILPSTDLPADLRPLCDKLELPDFWRRDFETDGLPTTRIERNTIGILGYRAMDRVSVMEEDFNLAQLYAAVARNCRLHPGGFEMITPTIHPHHVELHGRRPEWLKGVKSVEDEDEFGILVDPQNLGQPLAFVTVPPHGNTLDSICGIAGIQLPTGWRVRVEGAIFYGETTGIIGLRQGSSARLSVIPYGDGPPPDDSGDGLESAVTDYG